MFLALGTGWIDTLRFRVMYDYGKKLNGIGNKIGALHWVNDIEHWEGVLDCIFRPTDFAAAYSLCV